MITTVDHILDDSAIGGVTRFLDALAQGMGPNVEQSRHAVKPNGGLPGNFTGDVVVVHFTMSWSKLPYLLALRARRGRRPIVLVEHSYSGAFEKKYVSSTARFRAMLRIAYAVVDRVVAVSYGQAAWLRRSRLLSANKLTVIRPFTDCAFLASLPAPAVHPGPLRLGAYGRYCAQKDFGLLIDAMREVDPSVATLSLRGFGPDRDALLASAATLPHVTVGPRVDDLSDFFAGVDALVVPSCFEPFGQVALEGRLAARPVIVTDIDGLPEQVEADAGWVVPHGDPHLMAEAIVKLAAARKETRWNTLCASARTSALDHADNSVRRWSALLQELTARRGNQAAMPQPQMSSR